MLPRTLLTVIVIALLVVAPAGMAWAASAQPQAPTELLTNSDFEEPYVQSRNSFFASGWSGWWLTPDGVTYPTACPEGSPVTCMPYAIPSYRNSQPQDPRDPPRSISGGAQSWGTTYAAFVGGVYQRVVNITPGTQLRFSVSMMAFNCTTNLGCYGPHGEYGKSYEPGDNKMRVGIDPTGGTDPFSSSVVWSLAQNPIDVFLPFQVEAVAQADAVTVFTWAAPQYPALHNVIYADNASLIAIGQGPAPTAAQTPQAAPTHPPATPPSGTTTYTVQAGDTLSGIALQFGIALDQLLALNNLTQDAVIQIGQVLIISGTAVTPAPAAQPTPTQPPVPTATPPTSVSGTSITYVVKEGDTLFSVAAQFNLTLDQLLALNNIARDALLQTGQTLVVGIASPTPTPTAAPRSTPTALAGGLCVLAFDDLDANGKRDADEPPLADVQFAVNDAAGNSVARYTSTTQADPHCLDNLPAGRFSIKITPPAGRQATNETSILVGLLAGETFNVAFGSTAVPTHTPPTASPTTQVTAQAESGAATNVPLALIGFVLLVAAGAALNFGLRARRK